jgi:hypothetical protein
MSGITAARLHDLWLPPSALTAPLDVTVVATERGSRLVSRPRHLEFVVHRRRVAPDDIVAVRGVPTTSIARTWRDPATRLPRADLVALGDSALRAGTRSQELALQCRDVRGRPGARAATSALPLLDARSRSRPESHMRMALVHPDLPAFAVNEAVVDDVGQWLAEPDLSLAAARLALEYQGATTPIPHACART